jgi:hypothetical protein
MDMYFELCSMYLCYCMVGFFFALVELLPRVVPLVFLQTLPNNAHCVLHSAAKYDGSFPPPCPVLIILAPQPRIHCYQLTSPTMSQNSTSPSPTSSLSLNRDSGTGKAKTVAEMKPRRQTFWCLGLTICPIHTLHPHVKRKIPQLNSTHSSSSARFR